MKKKCYLYTRVSTAAQTEGYSLEAQQECLKEYAAYRDLVIAGEYCDAGKSGHSIKGRPSFIQMLDDIMDQKDNISFVLVYKLSRFGRNAADVLKSLQTLMDYGVDLVCVEDAIDSSTAGGRLTLAILSAVAEIERENITVQFMAGRMQKIMSGGWPGGPVPYGYRMGDKGIEIVEAEAAIVRKVYEMYLQEGMTMSSVAISLNEQGITKGSDARPFRYDDVKRMLRNPTYCGRISYNRRSTVSSPSKQPKEVITVQGNHEPIVSAEIWEQAEEKWSSLRPASKKGDGGERISLLSGLVKCPLCGAGMISTKNKGVNHNHGGYYKIFYSYTCINRRKSNGRTCSFNSSCHQERTDAAVFELMSKLPMHPAFLDQVQKKLGDKESEEGLEEELKKLRKKLRKEERKKRKLGEDLDTLDILDEAYDKKYDAIQTEMEAVYDRMDFLEESIEKQMKKLSAMRQGIRAAENVVALLGQMQRLYEHMSPQERREMFRLFIERIEVYPKNPEGKIIKSISFKVPVFYGEMASPLEQKADEEISFYLDCSEKGLTAAEAQAKGTYVQLKAYIFEKYGTKVSTLYIAQTKRKYGVDLRPNYNKSANPDAIVHICPFYKEEMIVDALKHFKVLEESVELLPREGVKIAQ